MALHQIKACLLIYIEMYCKYAQWLVYSTILKWITIDVHTLTYSLTRWNTENTTPNQMEMEKTICIIRLYMRELTYHDLLKQISFSTSISWQLKLLLLIFETTNNIFIVCKYLSKWTTEMKFEKNNIFFVFFFFILFCNTNSTRNRLSLCYLI